MDTSMNVVDAIPEVAPTRPPSKQLLEVQKLRAMFENQADQIDTMKATIKTVSNANNSLMKQIKRIENKMTRTSQKAKTNRKPHGFARPTEVSEELCVFMGKEKGTLVSRTDVTKSIIQYISDNKLQNPENKRQILPDATLLKLFGEEANGKVLDYFTMQKYVNHHFPKKAAAAAATNP